MKKSEVVAEITDKKLTKGGKALRAKQFLDYGLKFYGAAILLRKNNYDGTVTKHLVCQSLEILLKGILLKFDFDKYNGGELKKIGHDLDKCLKDYKKYHNEFGVEVNNEVERQIKKINPLYKKHCLRYATILSLFVALEEIEINDIDGFIQKIILKIKDDT